MATVNGKTVETDDDIPAFGWKVVSATADECCTVTVDGLTAQNKYYRLTLDNCGRIVSLFDKRAEREVIKSGCAGNEIQVFEDYPRSYDNWEMTDYYKQKMWVLDEPAETEAVYDGSRAGFKVVKKYHKSTIHSISGCTAGVSVSILRMISTGMNTIRS